MKSAPFVSIAQVEPSDKDVDLLFTWYILEPLKEASTHTMKYGTVAIQNFGSGKYMTCDDQGVVSVDRSQVSDWEKLRLEVWNHDHANSYRLKCHNGNYLIWTGGRIDATTGGEHGAYMEWTWESAFKRPAGTWLQVGTATDSRDSFTITRTYSSELATTASYSLGASFTYAVEGGFEYEGVGAKSTYTGTISMEMSQSVTKTISQKSGTTATFYCPADVCVAGKTAFVYQFKVSGSTLVNEYYSQGDNIVFALSPPRCPPYACIDDQCQKCKPVRSGLQVVV